MTRFSACIGLFLVMASPCGAKTVVTGVPNALKNQAMAQGASAAQTAAAYGRITSVFRSAAHNRAVGGVANSYHLRGQAIDVARRPGVSHQAVEAALIVAGYQIIESLDEGDHSHFAFGARTTPRAALALFANDPANVSSPTPPPSLLAADQHGSLLVTGSSLIDEEPTISSPAAGR